MKSPVILRVFKNSQLVEVKQFEQNQIVLGHEADVHLDLAGDGVSAIHCMIEMRDNGYYVCDLGSQSGTFKNGQAVLDSPLSSGDEIGVGPFKITFFYGVPKTTVLTNPVAKTPESKLPPQVSEPKVPAKPAAKSSFSLNQESPKANIVTKPEIRTASAIRGSSKKNKRTFAPASEIKDLSTYMTPGKGSTVEVIVAWKERVLTTYHFKTKGVIRIGSGENYQIELPGSNVPKGWPLLEISNGVRVAVGFDMGFELIQSQSSIRKNLDEVVRSGKGTKNNKGTFVRLDQNEMICLTLMDGLMQIFIRFVKTPPVVPLIPALLLSGAELTAIVMSFVLIGLLAFYISATAPSELTEDKTEDLTRTAQIIFNNPPPRPPVPPPPPPEAPENRVPPPPEKAKMGDRKQEAQKKGAENKQASQAAKAGRAAEVAPIPNSQNRPKKFTSTKQGGAIKLGEKAGSNAASTKDLSKAGLFSAFGSGGIRQKLDTSYSGAGEILGQADKATGASGMDTNRAGDDLGSKVKDTGAGGKGTATEGISGIGTKGRSTGQNLYGSADGFGEKTSVAVEPGGAGEDFDGTIDKEAIRRVVRHYLYEIRGCYQKELNRLERGQRLEGKVILSWDIVSQGVAKNVKVASSTLNNKAVENCIRDRLASWKFPEPPVGMTAEIKAYPFYFKPER